uniref:Replication factor A C-terminal domain-containing protein n=1 Tax=Brassica oleracea var. oleracea TaxID=109376 RepID=A0A0D3BDX9_BRAOL
MCIDTIRLPNRSMVRWLVARDTGLPSAAPLLRSYAKVETMTMAELNAFVVNAASQEIDFLRIGRFVRLDKDKGWCYAACSKCSKKLQRTASAFTCARCNNLHAVGALRCSKQWDKMNSRLLLGCYLSLWITLIICL